LILASMILVWSLLYFPCTDANGDSYDQRIAQLQEAKSATDSKIEQINELESNWKQQSYLGRLGKFLEPAVVPLGWDWRIGMAALAYLGALLTYQVGMLF